MARRTPEEIAEAQRHEELLNVAFGDRAGFTLMCPYDRSRLDENVLAEARGSHPVLVQDGVARPSSDYGVRVAPYDGSLPEPTGPVECLGLPEHSLADVRSRVSAAASAAGLGDERTADVVLTATEAATNSLNHAGGRGEVRWWRDGGRFVCEVRDHGRISDPLAGRLRVAIDEPSGRGLWLINQLCDLVQIRSSAGGNVVRMHVNMCWRRFPAADPVPRVFSLRLTLSGGRSCAGWSRSSPRSPSPCSP